MLISSNGVENVRWTEETKFINGDFYREEILKKYILNKDEFKRKANPYYF